MSLKDRIEAKARRTAAFPLQVGDVGAAEAEIQTIRAALEIHLNAVRERGDDATDADHERTEQLRRQITEAKQRAADTVVMVEIQALPDHEWDTLFAEIEEDENGDYDIGEIRPELLAACCVDPDLQDDAWWTMQLARPEWTKGDKIALDRALLTLNLNTPDGRQGKG